MGWRRGLRKGSLDYLRETRSMLSSLSSSVLICSSRSYEPVWMRCFAFSRNASALSLRTSASSKDKLFLFVFRCFYVCFRVSFYGFFPAEELEGFLSGCFAHPLPELWVLE